MPIFASSIGAKKLGQPDPESNLVSDENNGVAVGAYGLFYRTIDGGVTWIKELHASVLPQDDIDYLESIKDDPAFYEEELSFIDDPVFQSP